MPQAKPKLGDSDWQSYVAQAADPLFRALVAAVALQMKGGKDSAEKMEKARRTFRNALVGVIAGANGIDPETIFGPDLEGIQAEWPGMDEA